MCADKKAASLNCLFLFREPVGRFDDDSSIAFYRTDLECVWAVVVQTGYNLKVQCGMSKKSFHNNNVDTGGIKEGLP